MKHILKYKFYNSNLTFVSLPSSHLLASSHPRQFSSNNTDSSLANKRILVTGCKGQIGQPLVHALCKEVGSQNVIATDCSNKAANFDCQYQQLDVTNYEAYKDLVQGEEIDYIVHLAAILSAIGEKMPDKAIQVNVDGFMNALNIARDENCQIFVPSSIAVFGGQHFDKKNTPLNSILQPSTVYGVTKVHNELMGNYYFNKFGVDFRSVRYPGIISSEKYDFNGTTDYSTEIFFAALDKKYFKCCLGPNTALPMMYIDDCIKETIKFLQVDSSRLTHRVYNIAGISFTPMQLVQSIKKMVKGFEVEYEPDFRQTIADSWPKKINDIESKLDWDLIYDISVDELAQKIMDGIDENYKKGMKLKRIGEAKSMNIGKTKGLQI